MAVYSFKTPSGHFLCPCVGRINQCKHCLAEDAGKYKPYEITSRLSDLCQTIVWQYEADFKHCFREVMVLDHMFSDSGPRGLGLVRKRRMAFRQKDAELMLTRMNDFYYAGRNRSFVIDVLAPALKSILFPLKAMLICQSELARQKFFQIFSQPEILMSILTQLIMLL